MRAPPAATATPNASNAAQAGPAGRSKQNEAASARHGTPAPSTAATMNVARMLGATRSAVIAGKESSANVGSAPISCTADAAVTPIERLSASDHHPVFTPATLAASAS